MNIFILTMDDPIQTKSFIKHIIVSYKNNIVGLAVSKGNRLTIQKQKSKLEYILSLLLIMGFYHFSKSSFITLVHKTRKLMFNYFPKLFNDPTVKGIAERYGIKTWSINNANDIIFLEDLKELNIDVIINQSQNILKSGLLSIPKIGVINRHNALLPKNRGRLTPFWVLYNNETETGVSIHMVTEELDAGDIIVQKKFKVLPKDTFNSIVKRNYKLANSAILEALTKLENGENDFIHNDSLLATYNSTPTLKDAWTYRINRIKRFLQK